MKPSSLKTVLRLSASTWVVVGCVVSFFLLSHFGQTLVQGWTAEQAKRYEQRRTKDSKYAQRLVALTPSNVEALFALGLGDHVVGVSRYTSYPEEAVRLPKLCGMVDVDFEKLVTLEPDCIVMLESQESLLPKFAELGIKTLSVNHESVEGIISSFVEIAEVCGNEERAHDINTEIRAHISSVRKRVEGKSRPRVLVCIHHSSDISQPEQIVACGNEGYHQELIDIAGGVNAYQGAVAYPKLSRENLININPDIIIDLVNKKVVNNRSKEDLKKLWDPYSELEAVKNGKIVIVDGAEHFLPGPRFLRTLDAFSEGIHGVLTPRESKILQEFEGGAHE